MREKIIIVLIVLGTLVVGILGTLYFSGHNNGNIVSSSKNITINESDSINASIKKIYNAVVVVESYTRNTKAGSGSGFVYKKDGRYGYILTNYHVVSEASELKVVLMNGEEVEAKYLGGDSYADIAVIRIDAKKVLDVATIGDSSKSTLGDTVFTVGTPINSEYIGSVTKGIVSGEARTITVSENSRNSYMMEVIQTDASINPGNSGGPLVNINGEVIGITSMKLVTESIEGMGFAIPIEIAMSSVSKLEKGGTIERPYIGVNLYDINNSSLLYRNDFNIDSNLKNGVIISAIEPNSSADKAGLEVGDVITQVDKTKVKSIAHFKHMLYKHSVGDTMTVKINRSGKEKDIKIKLDQSLGN